MNNWERMKAGRLYNADSKDLEKYHSFGMETCDKFNRTPLHHAANNAHTSTCQLLIDRGADCTIRSVCGLKTLRLDNDTHTCVCERMQNKSTNMCVYDLYG